MRIRNVRNTLTLCVAMATITATIWISLTLTSMSGSLWGDQTDRSAESILTLYGA